MSGRICVYKMTNKVTGDFYIGSTVDLARRMREHFNTNKVTNEILRSAIDTYGRENFQVDIIEDCTSENLRERETFYIEQLKPTYNLNQKAADVPDEMRARISKKMRDKWESMSDEERAKVIKNNLTYRAQKGHGVSEYTRSKIREARAKQVFSKESRERAAKKIKEFYRQHPAANSYKNSVPVILDDGTMFYRVKDCAEFIGVRANALTVAKREGRKYCVGYRIYFCGVETTRDECNGVGAEK